MGWRMGCLLIPFFCQLGVARMLGRRRCYPPHPSSNPTCDIFSLHEPIVHRGSSWANCPLGMTKYQQSHSCRNKLAIEQTSLHRMEEEQNQHWLCSSSVRWREVFSIASPRPFLPTVWRVGPIVTCKKTTPSQHHKDLVRLLSICHL